MESFFIMQEGFWNSDYLYSGYLIWLLVSLLLSIISFRYDDRIIDLKFRIRLFLSILLILNIILFILSSIYVTNHSSQPFWMEFMRFLFGVGSIFLPFRAIEGLIFAIHHELISSSATIKIFLRREGSEAIEKALEESGGFGIFFTLFCIFNFITYLCYH